MVGVDAAGAGAELVHVGLAGEDGAARAQLRHARRVGVARPCLAQPPRPACTCPPPPRKLTNTKVCRAAIDPFRYLWWGRASSRSRLSLPPARRQEQTAVPLQQSRYNMENNTCERIPQVKIKSNANMIKSNAFFSIFSAHEWCD